MLPGPPLIGRVLIELDLDRAVVHEEDLVDELLEARRSGFGSLQPKPWVGSIWLTS